MLIDYKFLIDLLFAKYQLHIFVVILVFAYQQFKTNKRLEVQTAKCEGRFVLQDYKIQEVKEDLKSQTEKINNDYVNLFNKAE